MALLWVRVRMSNWLLKLFREHDRAPMRGSQD